MTPVQLDESTLAGFLAGTLSTEERARVTEALAKDPESRELLRIASDMMVAASQPQLPVRQLRSGARRQDRAAKPKRSARPIHRRIVAAAAVVLLAAVSLTLSLSAPETDLVRTQELTPDAWRATIEADDAERLEWAAVPEAATYRVVVWNANSPDPIISFVTEATSVSETDYRDDLAALTDDAQYVVRIYASDERGRNVLDSSNLPLGTD